MAALASRGLAAAAGADPQSCHREGDVALFCDAGTSVGLLLSRVALHCRCARLRLRLRLRLHLARDVMHRCECVHSPAPNVPPLRGGAARWEQRTGKRLISAALFPQDGSGNPVLSESGKYCVKLYFNGVARKVTIDDRLPVDASNKLLCSYSSDPSEFWVSLIERAYMKLHGGYDFPGSHSGIDVYALTGCVTAGDRVCARDRVVAICVGSVGGRVALNSRARRWLPEHVRIPGAEVATAASPAGESFDVRACVRACASGACAPCGRLIVVGWGARRSAYGRGWRAGTGSRTCCCRSRRGS